jgi:hypothetical protein
MNAMHRTLLALALTLPLTGCDPTAPVQPEPKPEPEKSALDAQFAPIERAKSVEGDVLDQAKAQDEAMRAQGG